MFGSEACFLRSHHVRGGVAEEFKRAPPSVHIVSTAHSPAVRCWVQLEARDSSSGQCTETVLPGCGPWRRN